MSEWNLIMLNPYALKEALEELGIRIEFKKTDNEAHIAYIHYAGTESSFTYFVNEAKENKFEL